MRVMASVGYERATIARVAAEAGLAPGLVHYHFASKQEILAAVALQLVAGASARIDARTATAGSAHERLGALLDALLARGDDADPAAAACWAMIGAEAVKDPDVRRTYAAWIASLVARTRALVIEACHESGRSGEGAAMIAAALIAAVEGFFQLAAAAPETIPAGSAAASARRMATGLVSAQPPREGRSS